MSTKNTVDQPFERKTAQFLFYVMIFTITVFNIIAFFFIIYTFLAEQQRKIAARKKGSLILLYCNLDGLKEINDSRGYKAGDEALIQTANILRKTFRESDIIGRIGEDEFIILMVDTEKRGTRIITERIQKVLNEFNANVAFPPKLSLSIGFVEHDPERPLSL
ncbi:GGDEF domain-containing protein [Candidatus Sumerlaeota bacterium]|nr:GGDEF domain-containing protein [Candidatus Sumerlaeota bacterium]